MLQYRIACLRIPRFQIVAHQRLESELKGKAFVLVSEHEKAKVLFCSKEAAARQLRAGMKLAEANAACSDLLWRKYDPELCRKLQLELSYKLIQASPQVSSLEPGVFLLDASGLTHLGGETKFCRRLQKLLSSSGFTEHNIGIADSAFAAQIAGKFKRSRQFIVPQGKDREFLAPLSLHHLPLSAHMHETLRGLGLKTIGQLLQIPAEDLLERFGQEGLFALDLAFAHDKRKAQTLLQPKKHEAFVDLNFPVDSLAQTQFILKSMLDSICSALKENSLLAEELEISFFNDNTKFEERPLNLMRPSNNARFLLELIKLSLESKGLAREFTALEIQVLKSCPESWQQKQLSVQEPLKEELPVKSKQLRLLDKGDQNYAVKTFVAEANNESKAESFVLLLQKLIGRMGTKSVLRAAASDQHIPDLAACFLPLAEKTGSVLPISISSAAAGLSSQTFACGLVLKKSRQPHPVLVELKGRTPSAVSYQGRWHKILELTEPERLSGIWWDKQQRKSYYIALIDAGGSALQAPAARASPYRADLQANRAEQRVCFDSYLILLVHDHESDSWQLQGFFD